MINGSNHHLVEVGYHVFKTAFQNETEHLDSRWIWPYEEFRGDTLLRWVERRVNDLEWKVSTYQQIVRRVMRFLCLDRT